MERSVFLLCSFSDQMRGRMRGDVQRRTAQGKNVRCGGQTGYRCVHHRWRSPTGHGQTPTGRFYHLGDTRTHRHTKKSINMCNECAQNKTSAQTCTYTYHICRKIKKHKGGYMGTNMHSALKCKC